MRSVLLIAFHYPPIGGAGAQRSVQLAHRLPEHGYRPIVLTGPTAPDYRWTPSDTSLGDRGVSPTVHRLEGPEPPHGVAWESRLARWARISPRWQRWWSSNLLGRVTSFQQEVDLVRASLAPYGIGPALVEFGRRLAKPLVLDLEDPWALDEMLVYPTQSHRRLELHKMRRVLSGADAVVMNTQEAAGRIVEVFPELASRVMGAIPNAFDPADFEGPPPDRGDACFRIVHTGSLHMDLGLRHRNSSPFRRVLGGAVDGVDFLPRSHVFLVEALEQLLQTRPDLGNVVEIHFAGVLTETEKQSLERVRFARLHGFLSHRDTIALLRSADLLFLPMHDLPPGRRATIVPQKTYEYVGSGRPILAAVPDGDARDLLGSVGTARLCRPSDTDAMARILSREIDRWRSREESPGPQPDVVAQYGAPRLASDMARLFDDVLASRAT
jgi:glycosyltransferase involved in cell wall biosynthesis